MAILLGIATHQHCRGEIEKHLKGTLQTHNGLGDFRGAKNPHTSVTLLSLHAWQTALAEAGGLFPLDIDWSERRANLLLDEIAFSADCIGRRLQVGSAILQITCETDPCSRMDALAQGLKTALIPDWRGGARCRVLQSGEIQIGDRVTWLN